MQTPKMFNSKDEVLKLANEARSQTEDKTASTVVNAAAVVEILHRLGLIEWKE